MLGLATGTWTHKTHHGPDSRVSHHLTPYSIICSSQWRQHPSGAFCWDSRNGLLELWTTITPDCKVRSQHGLNQSCSPRRDLFNAMLHSRIGHWEEVDLRLLVVGSQTASLTPDPSFAHNLGCRYPNGQCKAIFDIYVSRPFQWHQEHSNARCFAPCCRALNIRESRRTPNPNFSKCWASPPHLAKVGVRHMPPKKNTTLKRKKQIFKPLCTKNALKPPYPIITLLKKGEN